MSVLNISILNEFISGEERSVRVKKNIAALVFLKGISVVIAFFLVPMTLNYLNPVRYGIWLTMSSIAAWMVYLDFGLGNGLRNKLAEALANRDYELAKSYVSSAYFLIAFIIMGVLILIFAGNQFLNWTKVLNAPSSLDNELSLLAIFIFFFYGIKFVSVLIETILIADQKPAIANLIEVTGGMLSLLLTWILVKTTQGSLVLLGVAVGVSIVIIPSSASFILFNIRYKHIAPAWKYFKNKYSKQLISLGYKFFVIQINALIIFSTSNIIIIQLFSPAEVVPYNIAFKYYSIATMAFTIILMPFWSAYTEAYARNDITWIQKSIRKLKRIWVLVVIGVILMTIVSNLFYGIWIGNTVTVPILVSIFMGLYVLETTWCNIFVSLINGIGKIQLQLFASIAIGITAIPFSIILASSFHIGIAGVILAPCILLFPLCILWPIQAGKILSNTAKGIWNK